MADHLMTMLLQQTADPNLTLDPATAAMIVRLLQQSIEQNERILHEHTDLRAAVADHVRKEEEMVRGFLSAFPKKPDGTPDFEGHETFHTALIEEARERAAFFRGLRYKLIEKGFWGLIAVLGLLIAYWWSGQVRH